MKHKPEGQLAIDFAAQPAPPPEYSPEQRKAIEHVHGPMLVVAGAGTGKTTVLVRRIVNLIRGGHARPDEILAVTYSENAADELKKRVAEQLGQELKLGASTFHAYAFGLLNQAGRGFNVVDNCDLFVFLRRRLHELPLKLFIKAATPGKFLYDLTGFFARCEDELVDVEQYEQYVKQVVAGKLPPPRTARSKDVDDLPVSELIARCQEIDAVYRRVTAMLAEANLGTFGQMISGAVHLLESDPGALAKARKQARFILIDEFQDSNVAQIRLAKLLAGEEQNVFAVGDPDQGIYRFRGATAGAFEHFQRHFTGVEHVTLSENRRSLSPILRCAFQVIDRNPSIALGQKTKRQSLTSAREAEAKAVGKKLVIAPVEIITTCENSNLAEASDLAGQVAAIHAQCPGHEVKGQMLPCRWSDFAVLYRQHGHRDEVVQEFATRGIPASVKGVNVLDAPEVRDAFAGLHVLQNPTDGISLVRLAAIPSFAIDGEELQSALNGAKENKDIIPALQKIKGGAELLRAIEAAREASHNQEMDAFACLKVVLNQFAIPTNAPVEALLTFVERWKGKPITETGKLTEFLEYLDFYLEGGGAIALDQTRPENDNAVQLMSAHAAKGLEFPHVFIIRATSGSFPSGFKEVLFEFPQELRDPLTAAEGDPKQLNAEEERRLFYVAMTRARDTLALYAKQGRGKKDPTPPGYLRELLQSRSVADAFRYRAAEFRADLAASSALEPASTLATWFAIPARVPTQRLTLSATRLETYKQCPLKYKIQTEWNIPDEPVPAMQFGNAVHTALKAYYDAVVAGRPISRETLLGCFLEQLSTSRFEDPLQFELYKKQGIQQLGQFCDLRALEPVPNVVATEKFFQFEIAGVRVIGRMDRVDRDGDGLIVTDYKTGSPRSEDDAEKSLQLSIYAAAAKREWGSLPTALSFYNLETNEAATTERTEDQIRETEASVCEAAESIKSGNFRAKPGHHCQWCGFRTLCPATEERLFSIALTSAKAAN